jgi:intein/homing endonuclease
MRYLSARFGVNHARVSRRSGERENDERSRRKLSARNLLRNLLAFVGAPRSESSGVEMRYLSARFGVNHARVSRRSGERANDERSRLACGAAARGQS